MRETNMNTFGGIGLSSVSGTHVSLRLMEKPTIVQNSTGCIRKQVWGFLNASICILSIFIWILFFKYSQTRLTNTNTKIL